MVLRIVVLLALSFASFAAVPAATEHDYLIKDFRFKSGETLPELRMHYRTLGAIHRGANGKVDNAVLIMHGTTGSSANFMRDIFAGELFGPGQPLDAAKFFLVLPDGIGHGKSSKPSDSLHMRFPKYGYDDMVDADYRLLTEGLKIDHLRLVMGTSMGGMHSWVWAERYPDFMDAAMPLASLPVQIGGRNRMWRRLAMDAITEDPAWNGGEYQQQPKGLGIAEGILQLMSSNPVIRQRTLTTRAEVDAFVEKVEADSLKTADANDVLYALGASRDYDPSPNLEKITVPLLAINTHDDLINPGELGILERETKRLKHGRAVVIPLSDATVGHGSHTKAVLWKADLVKLLAESAK
jgi:homoserine O-acetyltransferase/O-succinyltransferase